jgi:histidinol dehydrogenase
VDNLNLPVVEWRVASAGQRDRIISRRPALDDTALVRAMQHIIDAVAADGDRALIRSLREFDGVAGCADPLRVSPDEVSKARRSLSDDLVDSIRFCIQRSRSFNERIVQQASWAEPFDGGRYLGELARPLESVGLFVPSGKGSFPSVLIQIGTPAVVAGVPRIAVVVPPAPPGAESRVDPATLVVADELGITEIYCLNGPSGVAALALGTESVPKVDKIVGPGSPAVAVAQSLLQRYGVPIVAGLGPTDSLIIADEQADPALLAVDLLNEAEYGADSSAVVVGTSRAVLEAASTALDGLWRVLPEPRRSYAASALAEHGGLYLVHSLELAIDLANAYAPEHLQIATAEPRRLLPRVKFAGTVLLGQSTTFASSNYAIGTPATLPTTGFARIASGVTAHTFLNRIAVAELSVAGFWLTAPAVGQLAAHEGFPAHALTVQARRAMGHPSP